MYIVNLRIIKVKLNPNQKLIEIPKIQKEGQKLKKLLLKIKNLFLKQQKQILDKKIILIII